MVTATRTKLTSEELKKKLRGVGRGGSPQSWGNKRLFQEYCTLPIPITLEQWMYLSKIGEGNVSAGFRLTVDNLKDGDITPDDIASIDRKSLKPQLQIFVVSLDEGVKDKIKEMRLDLGCQAYMFYHAAIRRHQENSQK